MHVSLNFDPSETISKEKMLQIATAYMNKIGFEDQPYLVYKHLDSGHPHIHIVSTTIKEDGSRINTHNLGRDKSEKARTEIEQTFGLVKAGGKTQIPKDLIRPIDPKKIVYGEGELKKSVSNIVNTVVSTYAFSSLPEFNAALSQFNVLADRGQEGGRIFNQRGLVYRVLDKNGEKIGVPIKASSITSKPTLGTLEKLFPLNEKRKEFKRQSLIDTLSHSLSKNPASFQELLTSLEKEKVFTVLRKNAEGRVYGITFVNNKNGCVFNGSDLGKNYSAAALQSRLSPTKSKEVPEVEKYTHHSKAQIKEAREDIVRSAVENRRDALLSSPATSDTRAEGLFKKKKKRKKKTLRK
jgi:hypothetical protein